MNEALKEATASRPRVRVEGCAIISRGRGGTGAHVAGRSRAHDQDFLRLTSVEPGFDPRNVLTFRMRLPDGKYKEASQTFGFCREAMSRVSALPGVERVAVATGFPLGRATDSGYEVEGQPERLTGRWLSSFRQDVSEDYHNALKIPLLEGRLFNARTPSRAAVLIVTQEFVAGVFHTSPRASSRNGSFRRGYDGCAEIVDLSAFKQSV